MIYIGIDPGITGAMAALLQDGTMVSVTDLPVIKDLSLTWVDGARMQSLLMDVTGPFASRVMIERVSSMPKQSSGSGFKFGCGFGSILSVVQARHIPLDFVTPAVWKKYFGLSKDKHASLHKARLLWPTAELHLAKHDGRAEALLIAEYARTKGDRQ